MNGQDFVDRVPKNNPEPKITVTMKLDVPIQRISDLLCCALEGGSNYWYTIDKFIKPLVAWHGGKIEYRHLDYPLSPGGALMISDKEGEEGTPTYRLDVLAIEKGLKIMNEKFSHHFSNWLEENDDAETGDVFLQCCLFGELVYG